MGVAAPALLSWVTCVGPGLCRGRGSAVAVARLGRGQGMGPLEKRHGEAHKARTRGLPLAAGTSLPGVCMDSPAPGWPSDGGGPVKS